MNFGFPNLRFPGFEGEWEVKMLGETFSIFNGYAFSSNASVDNGNLWVKIADVGIQEMKRDNISFLPFDFKEKYSKFILEKGDYVVALTRPILSGKLKIAKIDDFFNGSLLNQRVGKIQTNNHNGFIYYTLQRTLLIKEIENNIAGSDPPNLSPNEINSISIKLPVISEQQKITDFLEIIDTRIQTQKKIISQLKSQMTNLKDLIFEQIVKFKNGNKNNYSEWKEFKLSDLGNTFNGLSGKTKEHFGVGQKYIQYKQIFDSFKINIANCAFVEVQENENQNIVQYGDVFFTISSETPEEIGMSSVLLENVDNVYLNSFCFGFRTNSLDELIPEFSQFLFRSNKFRNEIVKLAQGSTRYNMSKIEFLKLKVKLPCKDEQIKIAQFLSSINEKINVESELLTQYENQKKYLLQNLFV
ncbi:restriction endonuclease subunit S [Chryseobacterium sp. CT-SW4]|uniref:restriction endonuclease subunit S n=1 Tax=Chryseobacterium sp. SW-1 TaxID=3157343 RepID=UPI003B02139F